MKILSCSCFLKIQFQQTEQTIIIHLLIPAWNFRVLRYRKKNIVVYIEKTIDLLDKKIEFIEKLILAEKGAVDCPLKQKNVKMKWIGSVVDWVELIYALYAVGCTNNEKITLKEFFDNMGKVFDIDVKEFSRTFNDIKNRVKGNTKFLDELKCALLKKIEETDEKPLR